MNDESTQAQIPLPQRSRLRFLIRPRCLLILAASALAIGLAGPNAWAWYQWRAARSALEHYHPERARLHLERCLHIWPNSVPAHLLASRAARQSGDYVEADRQIRACQTLVNGTNPDVVLEWALLQAANGNVREVESFLERPSGDSIEASRLIWEAMAEGYIRLYRILDALACLDRWLAVDPDNLRALELRGLAYQRGRGAHKGAADLRRVIELDPTRDASRWRLVICLLDMGAYDEAMTHLERIEEQRPGDPDVMVRLARCHNMLDHGEKARQILDGLLEAHPEHALSLRTRGQFALTDRDPVAAERWLRRAAQVAPNDYESRWLLVQALQQQKKPAQAQEELKKAEEIKDRAERLGDLRGRKMSERPLDPALHCEMGILLLRGGNPDVGERWLLSALSLDPDYRPAHQALAGYYERKGDKPRALEHRRHAQP